MFPQTGHGRFAYRKQTQTVGGRMADAGRRATDDAKRTARRTFALLPLYCILISYLRLAPRTNMNDHREPLSVRRKDANDCDDIAANKPAHNNLASGRDYHKLSI